jgi:hypothetical protein
VTRSLAAPAGAPDAAIGNMRNLVEGRPSELETKVGAIARLERKFGVEVPRRTFLYAALLPHERKVRDGTARAGWDTATCAAREEMWSCRLRHLEVLPFTFPNP